MSKALIYSGAFAVGLVSILLGFYLVPMYKIQFPLAGYMKPIPIFLAYFVFGVPPVAVFFRLTARDG